jgi:NAD+ kinase
MKSVGIFANPSKKGVEGAVEAVGSWCDRHGLSVRVDEVAGDRAGAVGLAPPDELAAESDLAFAFGGDGTLLHAVRLIASAGREIPVIGVNLGSLGFLTQIPGEELNTVLGKLDPENMPVSARMMLSVTISGTDENRLALNDVVVSKGADSRMMSFEARVDGELVTRYAADGLILATPSGSTAYSVSAGGPVVMPEVEAIVMTPICPHTLSMRSCVIPPTATVEVEMLSCDEKTVASTDGDLAFGLAVGQIVEVRRAATRAMLVDVAEHSYYEILRKKMHWAGRVRER